MKKVKVGIVGGSGYTGIELLRLLAQHPHAEIVTITGRKDAGTHVAKMFPSLRGRVDLVFEDPASAPLDQCDVVFFATPHGVAMSMAEELTSKGIKVIDLAADFRLKDKEVFKKWYKMGHKCPEILAKAVYGQPESMRDEMKNADVLGMAGCYPTTIELGLMPLLKLHKEVGDIVNLDVSIIADSKSGISGAGRKADISLNCAEFSDNFKAYGVAGHRHDPLNFPAASCAAWPSQERSFRAQGSFLPTSRLLTLMKRIRISLQSSSAGRRTAGKRFLSSPTRWICCPMPIPTTL